jgi:uncharacterized protein (DUF1501 family)
MMIGAPDILNASILIVDDQESNVSLLEQLLSEAGYACVAATMNPHEVCALHRKNRYDLILLDLQMPGMDGFEVMEGLKALDADGYANYATIRSYLALPQAQLLPLQVSAGAPLYGLHPALANLYAMYRTGEALAVHAVAGPYRARSHFEAQDLLEGGTDHRMTSGWLNRVAGALPPPTSHGEAMAIGMSVPLLLRGPANVANWAPHGTATLDADLYARIAALNHDDSVLGSAIAEGLSARGFSAAVLSGDEPARNRDAFPALAKAAGEMLGAGNGPGSTRGCDRF